MPTLFRHRLPVKKMVKLCLKLRHTAIIIVALVLLFTLFINKNRIVINRRDFTNKPEVFQNGESMRKMNVGHSRLETIFNKGENQTNGQCLRIGNPWNSTFHVENCIAAVLLVRIYRDDKPELTTYELEQWIRYLQYAGVDVIYLYDAYENDWEKLDKWVNQLFYPFEVIYHDWHQHTPYEVTETQIPAYEHATEQYKNACKWHLAMDMDEYPFVINDLEKGFLKRFISNFTEIHPECSELSFSNFIFSGYPTENHWLIERLQRRIPKSANNLDKPLYIARHVEAVGVHHNEMSEGESCDVDEATARFNHYWGARIQDWKPDTVDTLSTTIPDQSILPILTNLKKIRLVSNIIPANVTNRYWNRSISFANTGSVTYNFTTHLICCFCVAYLRFSVFTVI